MIVFSFLWWLWLVKISRKISSFAASAWSCRRLLRALLQQSTTQRAGSVIIERSYNCRRFFLDIPACMLQLLPAKCVSRGWWSFNLQRSPSPREISVAWGLLLFLNIPAIIIDGHKKHIRQMHANRCPRNHFGPGLPYFILMGTEIRSKCGLLFYWHITLLGIMSSSHFIVARSPPTAPPPRSSGERLCIPNARGGYYGAWNENQMDACNSGGYNCEGCYTLGQMSSSAVAKQTKRKWLAITPLKMLLLKAPLLSEFTPRGEQAAWMARCVLQRDVVMMTDSYQGHDEISKCHSN